MKHLAHDLLDKQMISSDREKVGRVDGIIIQLHERSAPRIIAVESGMETVLHRIHCGTGWLRALARRLGVEHAGAAATIPFTRIKTIGIDVRLSMTADETGANVWEDWLRRRVIDHIPWSGKEKAKKK